MGAAPVAVVEWSVFVASMSATGLFMSGGDESVDVGAGETSLSCVGVSLGAVLLRSSLLVGLYGLWVRDVVEVDAIVFSVGIDGKGTEIA